MALHARAAKRQRILDAGTRRQVPLRAVLLVLALVPSLAMVGLWAVNSGQLYGNWRDVNQRYAASSRFGLPVLTLFGNLQAERQLSAAASADPAAYTAKLAQQRQATDAAITGFQAAAGSAPAEVEAGVQRIADGLRQLPDYRSAVDKRTGSQQQTYDAYTGLIASDLALFSSSSDLGLADVNYRVRPVIDSIWGMEMLAREDSILTPGIVSGSVSGVQRTQLVQLSGAEQFVYDDKVLPLLPAAVADQYRALFASDAWRLRAQIEQSVVGAASGTTGGATALSAVTAKQWQQSVAAITPQLQNLNQTFGATITGAATSEAHRMAVNLVVNSAVGAAGVVLVIVLTLILTGVLRRRIFALRSAALDLHDRLPIVVDRLRRGETVDTDAELPEIRYGTDELGMLGRALNAARSSALETTVRQVEQHRGFERLLQRIARRTQLLIGLQMKRLIEMERRHEDPDVLEGLFDLDHLTARLRRYEENLVILGGGQPQRRWRKPVPLLDVLRSAQGEVQDYRRIRIEIETLSPVWLSERVIGVLVHILAELMENAVSFSKPPTPVEVVASQVALGLVIEIEDRGVGMTPEQYTEANHLMTAAPKMDVVSQADDARLGLFVVARLAAGLGVEVELRRSPFGGTRVFVFVPGEFVLAGGVADDAEPEADAAELPEPVELPRPFELFKPPEPPARPVQPEPVLVAAVSRMPESEDTATRLDPLPRRVRQASIVTELRVPQSDDAHDPGWESPPAHPEPRRSGASIGAFQRQSRLARSTDTSAPHTPDPEPAPEGD